MHERIANSEALVRIFGDWPSFHDAEVRAVQLDIAEATNLPSLEASIHLWVMTSEVDDAGYLVLRSHTLARLRFAGIADLSLDSFDGQNVLWDIEIEPLVDPERPHLAWSVAMPASAGMAATFLCAGIAVVSAVPFPDP
ncbi:MAG TPA: Imm50 family immunity protein [Solirubrobacteraceae bacterium]|nr:Imm50 family immunity protein [Solirubrobacteraceae bacterium]